MFLVNPIRQAVRWGTTLSTSLTWGNNAQDEYLRGDLDFHYGGRAHCDLGVCSYVNHAIKSAINIVQHYLPFWNASMGANHVIVLPNDHGEYTFFVRRLQSHAMHFCAALKRRTAMAIAYA